MIFTAYEEQNNNIKEELGKVNYIFLLDESGKIF